jgi:uncharacterized protein DUF4157
MADHDLLELKRQSLAWTQVGAGRSGERSQTSSEAGAIGRISCKVGDASCGAAHAGTISRSVKLDRSKVESSMLRLQRDFGNRYVARVIDRVTDGEGSSGTAIEREIDGARGGGQALDHGVRGQMEGSFGADFKNVRVHTDERADTLNHALSARAFTTGSDIFFRQGEYSPGSSGGRELLAHELTHVVQQNGDGVQRKMDVSQPGDPHEVEADQMAAAVMKQEQRGGATSAEASVQRQEMLPEDKDKENLAAKLMRQGMPEDKDKENLAAKLMRQEMPEEDKDKLATKQDESSLSRQEDEQQEQ